MPQYIIPILFIFWAKYPTLSKQFNFLELIELFNYIETTEKENNIKRIFFFSILKYKIN